MQPVLGPTPMNAALAHYPYYTLLHIEVSPVTGQSSETKHTHTHETMSTSMFVCYICCSTDWDSWESPREKRGESGQKPNPPEAQALTHDLQGPPSFP